MSSSTNACRRSWDSVGLGVRVVFALYRAPQASGRKSSKLGKFYNIPLPGSGPKMDIHYIIIVTYVPEILFLCFFIWSFPPISGGGVRTG